MSVTSKHMATFLLGLAAGVAAHKYMNMSDEEKKEMASKIKSKADELKNDAENTFEKAKDYFEDLKEKGSAAIKENFGDVSELLEQFLGNHKKV